MNRVIRSSGKVRSKSNTKGKTRRGFRGCDADHADGRENRPSWMEANREKRRLEGLIFPFGGFELRLPILSPLSASGFAVAFHFTRSPDGAITRFFSFHVRDHAFQICRFGNAEDYRMVLALAPHFEQADAAMRIAGGFGQHGQKVFLRYMIGA